MESKKEFIHQKYQNFINFLVEKSSLTYEQLQDEEEIKDFKNMQPEDIIKFGMSTLRTYKNNLDYPASKIMEIFKIDINDRSAKLIIFNYLELILSLST
jgi:hypothetical protein